MYHLCVPATSSQLKCHTYYAVSPTTRILGTFSIRKSHIKKTTRPFSDSQKKLAHIREAQKRRYCSINSAIKPVANKGTEDTGA